MYLVAISAIYGFPSAFGDLALKMLRYYIQGGIRTTGLTLYWPAHHGLENHRMITACWRARQSLLDLRKRHADQNSRFLHIVMRIAHDADGAWLHHHREGETRGMEKPSLRECAQDMAVRYLIGSASET